ncbi:MAG: HAD family hydrolase [Balneolaceae bacterium]
MELSKILKSRFLELSTELHPIATETKPKLKYLRGVKAVIFDFYGTLFISGVGDIGIDDGQSDDTLLKTAMEHSGINIIHSTAGKRGYEIYGQVIDSYIQKIKKTGIPFPEPDIRNVWHDVLSQMHAEELISTNITSNHAELMSVEFEARMNPVWPMSDLHEILDGIKEKGCKLGIISNSQFYTPIALEALTKKSLSEMGFETELLHWSFEESRKKPGLKFYELFLEKAKRNSPELQAENYLYVGNDMLKDVYPANKLGMKTALFAGDQRSLKWRKDDERCANLQPDIVVTELKQILDCI